MKGKLNPTRKPSKRPKGKDAPSPELKSVLRRLILIGTVVTVIVLVGVAYLSHSVRHSIAAQIPEIPDLSSKTESLRQAVAAADENARNAPASEKGVGYLGLLYHANHLYEQAAECYVLAMEVESGHARWPHCLAVLRQSTGHFEECADLLRQAVDLAPAYLPSRLRLADLLLKQGRQEEAEREYHVCLEQSRDNPYVLFGLARMAVARKEWDTAESFLRRAIGADGRFGSAHRLLATVLDQRGLTAQADASRARAGTCGRFRADADPWLDELDQLSHDPAYVLIRADTAA